MTAIVGKSFVRLDIKGFGAADHFRREEAFGGDYGRRGKRRQPCPPAPWRSRRHGRARRDDRQDRGASPRARRTASLAKQSFRADTAPTRETRAPRPHGVSQPIGTSGRCHRAVSAETTRSQDAARINPPPSAKPSTEAITGLRRQPSSRAMSPVSASNLHTSSSESRPMNFRSLPAQNPAVRP